MTIHASEKHITVQLHYYASSPATTMYASYPLPTAMHIASHLCYYLCNMLLVVVSYIHDIYAIYYCLVYQHSIAKMDRIDIYLQD